MAYTSPDFKSAAALKRAIAAGEKVTVYSPGIGGPYEGRTVGVEGPHYPKPHSWYATVVVGSDGTVVEVKK
jgi:hypothetical protein